MRNKEYRAMTGLVIASLLLVAKMMWLTPSSAVALTTVLSPAIIGRLAIAVRSCCMGG